MDAVTSTNVHSTFIEMLDRRYSTRIVWSLGIQCSGCEPFRPDWSIMPVSDSQRFKDTWTVSPEWFRDTVEASLEFTPVNCAAWRNLWAVTTRLQILLPVCAIFIQMPLVFMLSKDGVLTHRKLPCNLETWITEGRKYLMKHRKLPAEFHKHWIAWWISLQPAARRQLIQVGDIVELPHSNVASLEWSSLKIGGQYGITTIVFSLALCYPLRRSDGMSKAQWHRWVFDVMWVFICLSVRYVVEDPASNILLIVIVFAA